MPSRHRTYPSPPTAARRALALLLLAACAAAAVWFFVVRPKAADYPSTWDPRIAALALDTEHDRGLAWKHPVQVTFLAPTDFEERFGVSAAAGSSSSPIGGTVAQYVDSQRTVFVRGQVVDVYTKVALVGQLVEAMQAQYPGSPSPAAVLAEARKIQAEYVTSLPPAQVSALRAEEARGA